MPMGKGSWALGIVGAIAFVLGLLVLGNAVSLSTAGNLTNNGLNAAFAVTTSAHNTSVTLQLANSCPTVPGLSYTTNTTVSWGDGGSWVVGSLLPACQNPVPSGGTLGSGPYTEPSASHTYTSAGTYTITDIITQTIPCSGLRPVGAGSGCQNSGPTTASSSVQYQVTVPSGNGTHIANGGGGGIGGSSSTTLAPGFTATLSGLSLQVTDTSLATNQSVKSVTFTFGDGGVVTLAGGGGTALHNYTGGGNYTVSETVTGSSVGSNGKNPVYTISRSIQVVGMSTCLTAPNTPGCSGNKVTLATNTGTSLTTQNLATGVLLLVIGVSFVIGALVPMMPWKIIVPIVGFLLAIGAYVGIGGII